MELTPIVALASALILCSGCEFGGDAAALELEGAVARVGDTVLTEDDVAQVGAQLGRYAQRRFSGAEGKALLLQALVDAEVLAQAGRARGLDADPRVAWAEIEEMAALALAAELERRVPRAEVAADEAALRAHYDAHRDDFRVPERRGYEGVLFDDLGAADRAHARVRAGEATLESLGEIVYVAPSRRDDQRFPGAHPILFESPPEEGALLAAPVIAGRKVVVARVRGYEPAELRPFHDPAVRDELVDAVRAQRTEAARAAYLAELMGG